MVPNLPSFQLAVLIAVAEALHMIDAGKSATSRVRQLSAVDRYEVNSSSVSTSPTGYCRTWLVGGHLPAAKKAKRLR